MKNAVIRNVVIAAVIILAIVGFTYFSNDEAGFTDVDTSVALHEIDAGNIQDVEIDDREQRLRITLNNEITPPEQDKATDKLVTQYPEGASESLFQRIQDADPGSYNTNVNQQGFLSQMLQFMIPMLLLFGLLFFFMSRMQGGRGGLFGVGKSRALEVTKDMPKTLFTDVAGEDEAVEELNEIRDFLQNPARYERVGAKIPRGVLLYGPPGTGKTLLARAVAGEAGVPFYSISGSDFVEMFVGVGASRVRDLFEKAKQNAPCIVFIDEIDAVGRHRGSGTGGGHDEREQTLNQLLVEMDGFDDRETVILIAATNRPDVLDPALLRPGRFDRQVPVVPPDLKGRQAILEVHAKDKPIAEEVNMRALAKRTIGMSGADLENVLNESALLAARLQRDWITNDLLEEASDRVVGGPRRKNRVISEKEKKVTAYHEGGHALAAWAMDGLERVHKVTILARGRTGGHAMVVPEDDKSLMTRADIIARIVMAMGGRAAEEYIFGEPTSGASSDIENATKLARTMVTEYGMSAKLGAVKYAENSGDPFSHGGGSGGGEHSDEIAGIIDAEVRAIIEAAHEEAVDVLDENREALDKVAEELLEKETLRQDDLERIFADVAKRPRITRFDDFGGRKRATKPPIKTPAEIAIERGEPVPEREDPFSIPLPGSAEEQEANNSAHDAGGADPSRPSDPRGAVSAAPGAGAGAQRPGAPGFGGDDRRTTAIPSYGTPPPPGWSAPGWPPNQAGQSGPQYQPGQPGGPNQPSGPNQPGGPQQGAPSQPSGQVPPRPQGGSGAGVGPAFGQQPQQPSSQQTTQIPAQPQQPQQSSGPQQQRGPGHQETQVPPRPPIHPTATPSARQSGEGHNAPSNRPAPGFGGRPGATQDSQPTSTWPVGPSGDDGPTTGRHAKIDPSDVIGEDVTRRSGAAGESRDGDGGKRRREDKGSEWRAPWEE